ncbi:hypothetical protein BAE44_0015594 [Dichanthelium oligosanthes]|uniref:Uncharacterized protein n=1 Tax=Dichanthelium oligosanthes TaxID=888268 RepID=A0A1E5VEA9_9POAL|nr:hypothetical protein BAE44_0015594 [Dichanthelium oligosanthes]
MDQHGEKEAADESQDSTEQSEDDVAAAEGNAEKSTDQHAAGYKVEESAVVVIKEVSSGEESSPPLLAHPCALLQLLLRACAGCLGLPGYCGDPKPAAVAAPEDAAAADSSQEGEGGDKANDLYMQGEVVTRVWAVRKPTPPGRPREGGGGDGGGHH